METRRGDLGRRVVGARRRRHGVGFDHLRSRRPTSCCSAPATPSRGTRRRTGATRSRARKARATTSTPRSIVAVNADTGEYAWHFQETPEDRWDFDSNAQITLADLTIDGEQKRVVLHAPKNGYFYILDAKTGKFLSGTPWTAQNWTHRDRSGHRAARDQSRGALRADRQAVGLGARRGRRALVAADELQPADRADVHPGQQRRLPVRRREGLAAERASASRPGSTPAATAMPAIPEVREQALAGHHRRAGRVGSGGEEGSVAGRLRRAVERRHAGDRGQPRVPGQRARELRRLRRRHRRASCGRSRRRPGSSPRR